MEVACPYRLGHRQLLAANDLVLYAPTLDDVEGRGYLAEIETL